MMGKLGPRDVLMLTADHGNDPTYRGTDHTREYVPLLVAGHRAAGHNLWIRHGFFDIAQTIADGFGLAPRVRGESFLSAVT